MKTKNALLSALSFLGLPWVGHATIYNLQIEGIVTTLSAQSSETFDDSVFLGQGVSVNYYFSDEPIDGITYSVYQPGSSTPGFRDHYQISVPYDSIGKLSEVSVGNYTLTFGISGYYSYNDYVTPSNTNFGDGFGITGNGQWSDNSLYSAGFGATIGSGSNFDVFSGTSLPPEVADMQLFSPKTMTIFGYADALKTAYRSIGAQITEYRVVAVSSVPEPSSYAGIAGALGLFGAVTRRRRKGAA